MRRGRGYVVVDVDIEGGQREEVRRPCSGRTAGCRACAAPGRYRRSAPVCDSRRPRARPAGRARSVPKIAAWRSRPSRPSVQASSMRPSWQPSSKPSNRCADMAAHLLGVGLDHGLDVRRFHRRGQMGTGEPKPAGCNQNSGSESGSAAGLWRRRRDVLGGCFAAGGAVPFHTSASSTGLASASSAGRSIHFTISSSGDSWSRTSFIGSEPVQDNDRTLPRLSALAPRRMRVDVLIAFERWIEAHANSAAPPKNFGLKVITTKPRLKPSPGDGAGGRYSDPSPAPAPGLRGTAASRCAMLSDQDKARPLHLRPPRRQRRAQTTCRPWHCT